MSSEELGPPWTILKLLRWTTDFLEQKGSESARLDAELLLSHVLELDRIFLYTNFDRPLVGEELTRYRAYVKRRAGGEPIAYILGHREFWTLDLKVDPRVLIPRPDTETLVRAALERIDDSVCRVVDIGTGSGAIALSLASERPELEVAATDLSADALEVARENAAGNDLEERVHFFEGDLLEALPERWLPLDMVVSNPPYVAEEERAEVSPQVKDFEPGSALFAGPKGLDVIERLLPQAFAALRPGGHLLLEIGHRQGPALQELLQQTGFVAIEILRDYGDCDRVAAAQKP